MLFFEKTAKKGITVLPKSAAKPGPINIQGCSRYKCTHLRRPYFLQNKIARRALYNHNNIIFR